jgi:S1-C subfamily serine protease
MAVDHSITPVESNLTNVDTLQSISDGIVEVVKKVSPSVVQVSNGHSGFGSGVVWDEEGRIVTSAHVIGRASDVEISLSGVEKSYKAKIIGQDRFSDVAVLQLQGASASEIRPIGKGNSDDLSVGQFVLALANPFGEKASATFGIITSANATIGGKMPWADNVIVSDTKLNPGYSGGPLVDAAGRMVGMNAAFFANRGISIPINALEDLVKNLSVEGGIKRAYLGIVSDSISLPGEVAAEIKQEEGLIVYSVEAGTPAKRAGVAVGDIVVKLDLKPVRNFYDLRKLLDSKMIGKPSKLSVLRGEKLTELTITPSEA